MGGVRKCAKLEGGIQYQFPSGTWQYHIDKVSTPALCCGKCMELPNCKSWSWVQDAGLDGCGHELSKVEQQRNLEDLSARNFDLIRAGHGADVARLRHLQPTAEAGASPCCDVLSADADGRTCGDRILSLVNKTGVTLSLARSEVAQAYPAVCGACGGGASRCWLHGGEPSSKVHVEGAVSGLPAREAPGKDASLMSKAVTAAFGGPGLDYAKLCPASRVQLLALR